MARKAGSSPPTRGTRKVSNVNGEEGRIIPAYAGNTFRALREKVLTQDHPRLRGEHCFVPGHSHAT